MDEKVTDILTLISTAVKIGGGAWLAWGVVQLGLNVHESNGPGMKSAIWQIIGGGIILAGGIMFGVITK